MVPVGAREVPDVPMLARNPGHQGRRARVGGRRHGGGKGKVMGGRPYGARASGNQRARGTRGQGQRQPHTCEHKRKVALVL